jgi:hypothetical protein
MIFRFFPTFNFNLNGKITKIENNSSKKKLTFKLIKKKPVTNADAETRLTQFNIKIEN